jgi:hypothetical protein
MFFAVNTWRRGNSTLILSETVMPANSRLPAAPGIRLVRYASTTSASLSRAVRGPDRELYHAV